MIVEILKSIPIILFIVLLSFMYALIVSDRRKKRKLLQKPKISVIIPCYNDALYIKRTIEGVLDSYKKVELIVVNDKSDDNSRKIIKELQKKYKFIFIDNKENLGKVKSINNASKYATNEILFFIDADVIVNKDAFISALERLEERYVGAVSCPNNVRNNGFLPLMQQIEYNMITFMRMPYNSSSCLSLWGSFIGIKKKAFLEVSMISENAITEDMDLALKLNEKGWEVKQALVHVYTFAPSKLKDWIKQKKRWIAGGIQAILNHTKIFIKHPLYFSFFIVYFFIVSFMVFGSIIEGLSYQNLIANTKYLFDTVSLLITFKILGIIYGFSILKTLIFRFIYSLYSIPFIVPIFKKTKRLRSFFLIIPYTLIYIPIFSVVAFFGFLSYLKNYKRLKRNERGW